MLCILRKKRGRWIVSAFFKAVWGAFCRLPLPMQILVVMMMLAGMVVGGTIVAHEVFHVDTCPWYPPDGCPKTS